MTVTTCKFTFQEYWSYTSETGERYELVDGNLVAMGSGNGLHGAIAEFLTDQFKALVAQGGHPWTAKDRRIGIRPPRSTRWDTARVPDVVVLPVEQWAAMRSREAIIELTDPPPLLVVEVVSESTICTDYRAKHSEYSVLEIPEYWIVDPLKQQVTVCQLQADRYNEATFTQGTSVRSALFPAITLTVNAILTATSDQSGGCS